MADIYNVMDKDGDGSTGTIEYDPEAHVASVNLKLPPKRMKQVVDYLNTEREFWTPESQEVDDYRIDRVKPVENSDYFRRAMSMLYGQTGVYVLWDAPTE